MRGGSLTTATGGVHGRSILVRHEIFRSTIQGLDCYRADGSRRIRMHCEADQILLAVPLTIETELSRPIVWCKSANVKKFTACALGKSTVRRMSPTML